MKKTTLLLSILITGCSTAHRSKYHSLSKGEGFSDKIFEDNVRSATFSANNYTKKSQAQMFATFRAIETCREQAGSVTHVLDIFDRTHSKTITRTSSSGYPAYYYGFSPFYQRYSGFGFGFSTMSGQSWSETLTFPEFQILYVCEPRAFEPRIAFREVAPEEMKHLVKDLSGGLQIEKILVDSPNGKVVKRGDIIIRASDERIQKIYQLLRAFSSSRNHDVVVDLLRDGELKRGVLLQGADVTDEIRRTEAETLKSGCAYEDLKERRPCKG